MGEQRLGSLQEKHTTRAEDAQVSPKCRLLRLNKKMNCMDCVSSKSVLEKTHYFFGFWARWRDTNAFPAQLAVVIHIHGRAQQTFKPSNWWKTYKVQKAQVPPLTFNLSHSVRSYWAYLCYTKHFSKTKQTGCFRIQRRPQLLQEQTQDHTPKTGKSCRSPKYAHHWAHTLGWYASTDARNQDRHNKTWICSHEEIYPWLCIL